MEKLIFTKKEFKEVMEVLTATAKDKVRPILQGVNFNSNEVVAVDGYRLALRKINQELKGSYTVHRDNLKEVLKHVTKDTEVITIIFNSNTVEFDIDNKENFVYNLLNGSYISYKSLIPDTFNTNVLINAKELKEAIKPLKKNTHVIIDVKDNYFDIKDIIQLIDRKNHLNSKIILGTFANKSINMKKSGDDIEILFNNTYIKEALKNYKDSVNIRFISNLSPMIITDNRDRIDIILPIRKAWNNYSVEIVC